MLLCCVVNGSVLMTSCSVFEAGRLASKVASGGTSFVQPE
jgi:hypothetical protein